MQFVGAGADMLIARHFMGRTLQHGDMQLGARPDEVWTDANGVPQTRELPRYTDDAACIPMLLSRCNELGLCAHLAIAGDGMAVVTIEGESTRAQHAARDVVSALSFACIEWVLAKAKWIDTGGRTDGL